MIHEGAGVAVRPEELAEVVFSQLVGGAEDAVERFRAALDDLVRDEAANDGMAASIAAGDGLWEAVEGDGGDAISTGAWRHMLLSQRSANHV